MAHIVSFPGPGCIVEFIQDNKVILACVLEAQATQLRLYTIGKKEVKIPPTRLLPWSGPAYAAGASRQDMENRLELHRARRKDILAQIDVLQLWELAQGEIDKASLQWFAELLWPEADIDQLTALGQALLNAKTHFKFNPPHFEIFAAELVEQRLQKAEADRRLEETVSAGSGFLRKLWEIASNQRPALRQDELPPQNVADDIKRMILTRITDPDSTGNENLWKMLTKSLPEDPHLPLLLAIAWGLKPPHYNFLLDRADYTADESWTDPLQDALSRLAEEVRQAAAQITPEEIVEGFISIDPASTQDWDDSFKVEALPDGATLLTLALACPGAFWPFGSILDEAVRWRSSSLYLPEGSLHMMPRALSLELFSLKSGPLLPAMLVEAEIDAQGALLEVKPRMAWVRIAANLNHEDCEAILAGGEAKADSPAAPYASMLRLCLGLSKALQNARIANGAVITERPETILTLQDAPGQDVIVSLALDAPCPLAQNVVGEFMILANRALAEWGTKHRLPLLYRTQDIALPKEFSGVWTAPHDIHRVIKALVPASLELTARPHAGLGVNAYATFTSPMRRYIDLVNEAQLLCFLNNNAPGLSAKDLAALLPELTERQALVGQVQRFRPRYWKLLYLLQQNQLQRANGKPWWAATVLEENDAFVNVNLECAQITLRAPKSRFGEKVYQGQSVLVRLAKINPLYNEIQIIETMEN